VNNLLKQTATFMVAPVVSLGIVSAAANAATFRLQEATIADINTAFDAGALTSQQLVQLYLNRINAYDQQGPSLQSIINLNPQALETAAALDLERQLKGPRSPLHGIPIILKDNYDTFDLPTTNGALLFKDVIPPNDGFQTQKLRDAGAVIIGKANLSEYAATFLTTSSLGGQTRNPYDLLRIPGGSSGGTGAAIAANFAAIGTGTDTLGSIRVPASVNSLVGLKPTLGLTSRDGIMPLSLTRDVGGPITRTVEDAAIMLDIIAGFDPADPVTATSIGKIPTSYTNFLKTDGLKGARIGVLQQFTDTPGTDPTVISVFNKAIEDMKALGADVKPLVIPGLTDIFDLSKNAYNSFEYDFNNYLKSLGSKAPVKTVQDIIASGTLPSVTDFPFGSLAGDIPPETDPIYLGMLENKKSLETALFSFMDSEKLDAVLYPTLNQTAPFIGQPVPGPATIGVNSNLASFLGLPAITVPGGFTPAGLPVGVELLGRSFSEPTLFRLAYSYEQGTRNRRPPASTPALPGEVIESEKVPEPDAIPALALFGLMALSWKFGQRKMKKKNEFLESAGCQSANNIVLFNVNNQQ
jgi:amidase